MPLDATHVSVEADVRYSPLLAIIGTHVFRPGGDTNVGTVFGTRGGLAVAVDSRWFVGLDVSYETSTRQGGLLFTKREGFVPKVEVHWAKPTHRLVLAGFLGLQREYSVYSDWDMGWRAGVRASASFVITPAVEIFAAAELTLSQVEHASSTADAAGTTSATAPDRLGGVMVALPLAAGLRVVF